MIFIFGLFSWLFMHSTSDTLLTINIKGVPSDQGKVMVGVYNKKDGFRDTDKTYKNLTLNARKGDLNVYLDGLPSGDYAVAVFHDRNENGKLDKNFLGIPTEKFGFSNDAMGKMGPPSYEQCLVSVSGKDQITIHLK